MVRPDVRAASAMAPAMRRSRSTGATLTVAAMIGRPGWAKIASNSAGSSAGSS